jgi:hypothetical protein
MAGILAQLGSNRKKISDALTISTTTMMTSVPVHIVVQYESNNCWPCRKCGTNVRCCVDPFHPKPLASPTWFCTVCMQRKAKDDEKKEKLFASFIAVFALVAVAAMVKALFVSFATCFAAHSSISPLPRGPLVLEQRRITCNSTALTVRSPSTALELWSPSSSLVEVQAVTQGEEAVHLFPPTSNSMALPIPSHGSKWEVESCMAPELWSLSWSLVEALQVTQKDEIDPFLFPLTWPWVTSFNGSKTINDDFMNTSKSVAVVVHANQALEPCTALEVWQPGFLVAEPASLVLYHTPFASTALQVKPRQLLKPEYIIMLLCAFALMVYECYQDCTSNKEGEVVGQTEGDVSVGGFAAEDNGDDSFPMPDDDDDVDGGGAPPIDLNLGAAVLIDGRGLGARLGGPRRPPPHRPAAAPTTTGLRRSTRLARRTPRRSARLAALPPKEDGFYSEKKQRELETTRFN